MRECEVVENKRKRSWNQNVGRRRQSLTRCFAFNEQHLHAIQLRIELAFAFARNDEESVLQDASCDKSGPNDEEEELGGASSDQVSAGELGRTCRPMRDAGWSAVVRRETLMVINDGY